VVASRQTSDTEDIKAQADRPVRRSPRASADASRRQCAATRTERSISQLIRFVAGPDDQAVPDLACKLPGRGVWVTADRASILLAIKSRAFSRSLKRQIGIPDDLPDRIEQLLVKRAIEALSLANKAGEVITGFDKVAALIERGRATFLVHGRGAAAGGIEKLDRKMNTAFAAAPGHSGSIIADCLTVDQLSLAMGRSNVVHAALTGGGAAKRFAGEASRLVAYRNGVDEDVVA